MTYCGNFESSNNRYVNTTVSVDFCPPDKKVITSYEEFALLPQFDNYTGSVSCGYRQSSRTYVVDGESSPCPSGDLILDPVQYMTYFDIELGYAVSQVAEIPVEITSLEIAESFTWGFGTYVFFWFLGFSIKTARMVIRKI